ncbi:VOC family protein [Gallaecimonas sp. GXIMD4217]|uniref:VOC family protein n=1 Tax=Gallaecimonas sp. GXIMD4217 TaxID=3131927 RepID=UPI00311AC516
MAHPIPEGFHNLTPYLIVPDSDEAIRFYRQAFGAVELLRLTTPSGGIGHAELQIGDSQLMLCDENPEWESKSPGTLGGTPVSLLLYVIDVDKTLAQALAAGATLLRPVQDQFYGDRTGTLKDPFGHQWTIATHQEDLSEQELQRRMDAFFSQDAG